MKKILTIAITGILLIAAAAPLHAYVISIFRAPNGPLVQLKWASNSFPIVWHLNPVQSPNVTGSRTQLEVFTASFASWQNISTASVSFAQGADTAASVRPAPDNVNLITTNTTSADLTPGVLGLTTPFFNPSTGQIVEADIFFSSTVPFSTNTTSVSGSYDLQAVATHEIGHLLGLDHSALISATMFWSVANGIIYPKNLSADDIAGVSILYPSSLFAAKGKISGTVRTTANAPIYAAIVVAVNSKGIPVASGITDPSGNYAIEGLDPDNYTVYADALDGNPIGIANVSGYDPGRTCSNGVPCPSYPGAQANINFTTRSR
jgi:hypothetical protein